MARVVIYWTSDGMAIRKKVCDYFKIPLAITVNGETYCEIDDSMLDDLNKTAKRGLIDIRKKKWKKI